MNLPKERYAMTTDNTVLTFQHPEHLDDPLTSVLRDGARRLLAQAVEAEAEAFLVSMKDERLADGRARIGTATGRSATSRPASAQCR
jgi:hypothetical protein